MQSYDLKQLIISKIPVHNGNNVVFLGIEDIISIQSGNGYTLFRTIFDEKYKSSKQLFDFDFILDNHPCMVKVNKSTYINVNQILSYSKGIICSLTMRDSVVIEISRRKKRDILKRLADKKQEK